MTSEAQRIAIAEACGWRRKTSELGWDIGDGRIWKEWFEMPGFPACEAHCLPDYINDLNAMHEAILSLPHDKLISFVKIVYILSCQPAMSWKIDTKSSLMKWERIAVMQTAKPSLLAEAFLRTIRKWKGAA